MTDILDSFAGNPEPYQLENLIPAAIQNTAPPLAAVRNRAATAAMLDGSPDKAVEKYQSMLAQGQEGNDSQAQGVIDAFHQKDGNLDMKAIMGILSDPKLSIEQKRGAIEAAKINPMLKDSGTTVLTKGLEAGSSGETREAEDARISTADALGEIYRAKSQIQGLVNAHGASLDSNTNDAMVDILSSVLAPFATSLRSYKMAKAIAEANGKPFTTWDAVKSFAAAGTSTENMRKQLEMLSPEARVKYAQTVVEAIKSNSGLLFANDNQYAQFIKATQVFEEGGYSTFEKYMDNISPLLDALGVGQVMRGGKVAKTLATTEKVVAEDVAKTATTVNTPKSAVSGYVPKEAPIPQMGVNDARIEQLQNQISSLLGDAGNLAGKGDIAELKAQRAALIKPETGDDVLKALTKELQSSQKLSFKEAKKQASKQIDDSVAEYNARVGRIDSQIEMNRQASSISQQIDALEKQISNLQKNNTNVPMKVNPIVDAINRIERNGVVRQEHPASVATAANNSNPEKARAFHEAVFKSSDDTIAEATHGVSKEQAIVNDVFPQATTQSGAVSAKAPDIQRNLRLDENLAPRLKEMLKESDVAIHYSLEETKAARANIIRDYSSATDLVPVDSMGGFEAGFKLDGSGIKISAVYGTKEGAFVNAQEAYHQALYGLRKQGILPNEVEVLQKVGLDYVPVDLKTIGNKEGSYLVRINTERMIDPTDITKFETETVKRNFFDRSPVSVWNQNGSVSRWMFDAASMISPRYTGAAVVATDMVSRFEKEMLHVADAYAKQYNGLNKVRKAKIDEYLKEANFKGLPFDTADLVGRGFAPEEISTIRSWRDFWDAHFYLENHDVVHSLNSQGFQMFKNTSTELYAKPITKNSTVGKVYDPATGMVLELSQVTLDELYAKGGTLAKLRRPTEFTFNVPHGTGMKPATEATEYMMVRNTPTEYLRRFRDSDQVLNYREGYYQLQYKAPRFVDEIVRNPDGSIKSRRAIAVAGDTAEAQHFADRQKRVDPSKEYTVRADDKAVRRGSDDWFDLNATSGRIAQKHRGKLLEDATGINHLGDGTYIVNPVESAVRAAKSISGRTVTRPMLETAKARFISQYGDLLPSNGFGGKMFPSSPGMIGEKGAQFAKRTADARTTWEYIHYLENGYINSVDEFFKQQFNAVGQMLGEAGMARTERAVMKATEMPGPTTLAKNVVFQAYIGLNPLHNWIAQTNQIVRTFAYNPKAWLTGNIPRLLGEYSASKFGFNTTADGQAFVRFIDTSGLLDSVDKQNLIRGSLLQAADSSNSAVHALGQAVQLPRKLGFDVGESWNLMGHGAAVFDKYKRAGKDVTDTTVMREMHSELRAISYDMNFAGDMVYNQTSAAAMLQFLQVPHKAFLQATNRRIPWETRARMLVGDIALFGIPAATITAVLGGDVLPDDPKLRDVFTEGLQSVIVNNALSEMMGEKVGVDFSPLAAESLDGWAKIFHGMFSQGMSQVILNSPSGQMFLQEGGRFQNAISQMAKFFSPWHPGERTNEEAIMVLNEVAKISSGWSNAMKARQQLALKKSMDKYGNVIDPEVNTTEAILQAFGYTTQDTRKLYETQKLALEGSKQYTDEVKQAYKDIKQYYQSKFDAGVTDPRQMQAVTGQILQAYADSPVALDIISKELSKDLAGKDQQLLYSMLKSVELPKFGLTVDQIKQSPLPEDQKQILIQRLTDAKNARSEIKKVK